MQVKSESEDAQSYPTLSDPMDCSLPGSSIHGIFQARVLEWGAIEWTPIKVKPKFAQQALILLYLLTSLITIEHCPGLEGHIWKTQALKVIDGHALKGLFTKV